MLCGLVMTIIYLALLLATQPYKRRDLDMLANAAQFALVCVFLCATCLRLFQDWETEVDGGTVAKVLGFESTVQIVAMMLILNLSILLIAIFGISLQALLAHDVPTVRIVGSGDPPELQLYSGMHYHVFLCAHCPSAAHEHTVSQVLPRMNKSACGLPGVTFGRAARTKSL